VEYCGFASAFLEFFEIASELWFACVAYDILASLVNPFSNTNNRMWKYHVFVWSISLAFALPTWIMPDVHGYWYVANSVDNTAICWIKAHKGSVSPYIYFLFYIPLLLVYIFAIVCVNVAYSRLRNGISNTLIHRMRALVVNALNVIIYIFYWFVAGCMLTCAYSFNGAQAERFNERLLLYMIASKGIASVFVWILTEDVSFNLKKGLRRGEEKLETEGVDLNSAMRSELLYFATSGIRNCARRGDELSPNQSKQILRLQHPAQKMSQLSLSFFFFLILGREKERRQIALMALASRKKQSVGMDQLLSPSVGSAEEVISNPMRSVRPSTMAHLSSPPAAGGSASLNGVSEGQDEGRLSQRCVYFPLYSFRNPHPNNERHSTVNTGRQSATAVRTLPAQTLTHRRKASLSLTISNEA
jgi:hypothetical protein